MTTTKTTTKTADQNGAKKATEPAQPDPANGIIAALVAFQAEMPTVAKAHTAKVPTKSGGEYRYTYADLADVSAAATPLLVKHGLAFTATPEHVADGSFVLTGTLLHVSGERISGSLPLFGRTAQEIGSSITYNRRYLLGCLTGIITDEDDDGRSAQQGQATRGHRNASRPPQNNGQNNGPQPHPPAQALADTALQVKSLDDLYAIHSEAQRNGLLNAPIKHPETTDVVPLNALIRERKTLLEG